MNKACKLLIGYNDFKNFCKMNNLYKRSKYGTKRRILECEIMQDKNTWNTIRKTMLPNLK